jgi:hypothetical protein
VRSDSDLTWSGFNDTEGETDIGIIVMLGRLSSVVIGFSLSASERESEEEQDKSVVDSFATTTRANVSANGGAVVIRTEEEED